MKVVFLEHVEGTAYPGDVKDVADGFARNYLLPRGFAVPATKSALQRAEALQKVEERRQAKLDDEAQALRERLEGHTLRFEERVGEQGRLFGSVTVSHIAEKVSQLLGEEFDRRKVLLADPLRQLGRHEVRLRLSRNVEHVIPVDVVPLGETEPPVPQEAPSMASGAAAPVMEREAESAAEVAVEEVDAVEEATEEAEG
ncbi:MAG TPA: 50S ribosomal protein L9 [Dehalococcoidia bacterium]|nr:50S ribosomal protein L9 [Dehalococcoidia bacterium]